MFNRERGLNLKGEATPAQIKLAEAIHALIGMELPVEKTKQAYSDYIGRHSRKYEQKQREVS